jgi:hypothetical protein
MRNYLIYAGFTQSADAAAQIQIIRNGTIVGVQWSVFGDLDANSEYFQIELSTVPTYQSAINDTQGVLSAVGQQAAGAEAAGFAIIGVNLFVPLKIPVQAGQLLYLNSQLVGTGNVDATAIVQVL